MSRPKTQNRTNDILNRISAFYHLKDDVEIAEFFGVAKSTISSWRTRDLINSRMVTQKCGSELASAFLNGNEKQLLDLKARKANQLSPPVVNESDDDFVLIPHLSGKISAGIGLAPENEIHVRVAFRKDWIKKKGSPEQMSLIKVKGDSMEPTLSSGDMILVDHSRNTIDPQGGIYAIVIDDMIMIKRLHVLGTNKIRIVSDNPHYEPIETTADELKINGKVLWFCRELER
jgi:phage repressor protein C with HTH and peptisase S24 domain